jgi:dihydrodipicolinate synthase/N-acetylneuraminate lyase
MIPLRNRYYTAMVLPFAADGSIDEQALRDLIRYYLADRRYAKVGGLIANPEAGEVYYLTPAEKRRVVEITMEEAGGKMPVFAGIFEMTTAGCVASAREMKALGVDGLFLMPPAGCLDLVTMWNAERYPEYWLDQIKAIDAAANLPIIAHPVGPVTPQWGIGIPGETARLICREVENVIAWKMTYSYDGMRRMWTILRALDRPVSIMAAGGKLFHEYMAYDIMDGTASGSWNYALEAMLDHIEAWQAEDLKRARQIWGPGGLDALHTYIYADYSRLHLRYKIAAWLRGLIPNCLTRAPMPTAKQEEIDTIHRLLREAGVPVIGQAEIERAA